VFDPLQKTKKILHVLTKTSVWKHDIFTWRMLSFQIGAAPAVHHHLHPCQQHFWATSKLAPELEGSENLTPSFLLPLGYYFPSDP
jgi:hypothetical protein